MNNAKGGGVVRSFTEGPVTKQMIIFAAPLFLSSLLQVTYNMVDMLVVGQFVGSAGISAVSVGGDVTNFLTVVVLGFSSAGSVIIAQFVGAGQQDKVGKFIGTMTTFLLACAVVLSAASLLLSKQILGWMNTPDEAWDAALSYATICMSGLIFIYGYNIVSAVLRGVGDSKHPFIFVVIATVINIVLDLLFVAGFHWGAAGAALATVLGQTFSFLISVAFLVRNRDRLGFSLAKEHFLIDGEMLLLLLKLGIPMAIKQAAVTISKLFVNSFINSYGVTVSAVAGISSKLMMIANMLSNATNTAGSTMVGQNIGAERYDRVTRVLLSVFSITLVISLAMMAVIVGWPKAVFGLFTDDADVLRVAMEYVPVAVVGFSSIALRSTANALINGAANFKVNFAVAILDGILLRIGLGLLFGLGLGWGYMGFWYGDVCASFTPGVIGIFYYLTGAWKTRKYVVK